MRREIRKWVKNEKRNKKSGWEKRREIWKWIRNEKRNKEVD